MEGLFDNLEDRSDSQNFEPLTSTLRFSPCSSVKTKKADFFANYFLQKIVNRNFFWKKRQRQGLDYYIW